MGASNRKKRAKNASSVWLWLLLAVIFGSYEFMIAASLAVFDALFLLPLLVVTASSLLTFFSVHYLYESADFLRQRP